MDFFWHYSSHETVDDGGQANFVMAISVCSQVFNTLTESVQVSACICEQPRRKNVTYKQR